MVTKNQTRTGHPVCRRILMVTNIDRGEANVFLATSQALLRTSPDVEVHFATFDGLQDPVTRVSETARRTTPQAKPVVFHAIRGLTMEDGIRRCIANSGIPVQDGYLPKSFVSPLRFSVTMRAIRDTSLIMVPYDGPQLVEVVSSIVGIITEVAPDLVVVDSLMTAGLTACSQVGAKFICLSPNSIRAFAGPSQPRMAALWKYPALFSGFPYPVPWHLIPLNIYYLFYAMMAWCTSTRRRQVTHHLLTQVGSTLRTPLDLVNNKLANLKILVNSLPELDFPIACPPHIYPCGPIVCPAMPVSEVDAELSTWLERGPTVYINLGSICRVGRGQALEMALALRSTFDTLKKLPSAAGIQVLWKLKLTEELGPNPAKLFQHVLGHDIEADRVRIVDWVQADPLSILRSGHVACSVHHGGANSYCEAVLAGVPQVVLPQWADCYDYAELIQVLGIGRHGSKTSKPRWNAPELSRELLAVLHGEAASSMKLKAKQLADLCQERGDGATNAASIILDEC